VTIFDGLADVFTSTLGQPVTVTPAGGAPRVIMAMVVARSTDDMGIVQQTPAIHARTVDVSDMADGDAVTIGAVEYFARFFRPDGRGMTTIALELDDA
jgi:hypothetical protein